jgi:hypothetical protein
MTVYIILTTAGADTGPFNIYSDVDGYVSAFETGVSKASLLAGYTSSLAPNGTTIVRVMSASALCTNYIDLTLSMCTTTTTTTLAPENLLVYLASEAGNGAINNSEVYYSIQPPPYNPAQPEPLGLTWTQLVNGFTIPECPTAPSLAGSISIPAGQYAYIQVRTSGGANIYFIGYTNLNPCVSGVVGSLYTASYVHNSPGATTSTYYRVNNPITTQPHTP